MHAALVLNSVRESGFDAPSAEKRIDAPPKGGFRRNFPAMRDKTFPVRVELQQYETEAGWHVGVRLVRSDASQM